MKKSVLILLLIANSITYFGQEISFKKLDLSDSVAVTKQLKQIAEFH